MSVLESSGTKIPFFNTAWNVVVQAVYHFLATLKGEGP
jgi:hypothetical protein